MKALASVLTLIAIGCVAIGQMAPVAPARKSLIENSGFETVSETSPPPGWVMWGAQEDKAPERFAADPENPHTGKYSLRNEHPANTHAYIVSDPDKPIETKRGKAYLVSFWSRTANMDEPGVVYWETHRGASPGQWPIHPSKNWTHHTYEIHEGVDFFADKVPEIFIAFRPTRSRGAEQTLWIDDVVITEVASGKERLTDPKTLDYGPLNHRLQPGEKFEIVVDANKVIGPAVRQVGGMSFHRLAGHGRHPYDIETKQYVLEPALEEKLRQMRLPMTRFYATGVEPWPIEETLDKLAGLMDTCHIPKEWTVIELETQGADEKLPPEFWARAAKYATEKGYGFRFWEISNEPYTRKATAFTTPDDYVQHVIACSKAIREVQPEAQIGIGLNTSSPGWGAYVMKEAAGYYDFVVGHYYCSANTSKFEDVVLTRNFQMLDHVMEVNALAAAYNPGREVYQLDTEWGAQDIQGEGPGARWRSSNIFAAAHRAARMIYYAREGLLRGASGWEMFSRVTENRIPGLACLTRDAPDKALMNYWMYYFFNRHCGATALDLTGTAPWYTPASGGEDEEVVSGPYTPTLVTLSEDGQQMYFVIANGSWETDFPCTVKLVNFEPVSAVGVALTQDEPNASGLVDSKQDVTRDVPVDLTGQALQFTVPGHSIVYMTVEGK